jgi:hypothetical protein
VRRLDAANRNPDTTPDVAVRDLAADQWGVLDTGDLRACGLSAGAVMRRCRRGTLRVVHPGVYATGPLVLHGRLLAAVKACGPGAVLSHRSAAALWRLIEWDESWLPEVTVPTAHARKIPGIVVHRTRVPFETLRLDGIPVTTPARAVLDLASVASYDVTRRAVREAMARKRASVRELIAVRGRKGGANLTRILADGYTPTRSELEDAVLEVIENGGIARPQINERDGRAMPDFRWPEERLILEADGKAWHDHRLAREDDVARQAVLEAAGWRVLRVTWAQAIEQPRQTIERLRAAGAPPGARRPPRRRP